jgi:hypothetical protein
MALQPVREAILLQDIVLLWILRHGGEWPDWNGDLVAISVMGSLAARLSNKALGRDIQALLKQHVQIV